MALLPIGAVFVVIVIIAVVGVRLLPRADSDSQQGPEPIPTRIDQVPAPPGDAAPTPGYSGLIDRGWAARMSAVTGIPELALIAYAGASVGAEVNFPGCGIGWNTLAAIGLVESDHGRHDGSVVSANGDVTPPIYGVALDGDGVATITDTDGGELDGDTRHDRAVGPMQLIPQTWRSWNIDGNGDTVADPQNLNDAALAAADYLCHASGGMSTREGWLAGIAAYNSGEVYLRDVAEAAQRYADAAASVTG